jgi:hypothetical protein
MKTQPLGQKLLVWFMLAVLASASAYMIAFGEVPLIPITPESVIDANALNSNFVNLAAAIPEPSVPSNWAAYPADQPVILYGNYVSWTVTNTDCGFLEVTGSIEPDATGIYSGVPGSYFMTKAGTNWSLGYDYGGPGYLEGDATPYWETMSQEPPLSYYPFMGGAGNPAGNWVVQTTQTLSLAFSSSNGTPAFALVVGSVTTFIPVSVP